MSKTINRPMITTLVPRLPPAIDGVGDYAFLLSKQLQHQAGLESHFIVADPNWQADDQIGYRSQAITNRSKNNLLETLLGLDSSTVVLHYVPHGYARKACPWWLIQGLEAWRAQKSQSRLVTIFHELYAFDWQRPWSSDFWLSPVQKMLASRLAQLSDVCLTSTEKYAESLAKINCHQSSNSYTLPVFSNIGEPAHILPLSERQRRLIIFGQYHSKHQLYAQSTSSVEKVCNTLGIKEIWDLGPSTGNAPDQIGQAAVKKMGALSIDEIQAILSTSMFGFLCYDPTRLAKSGIFAAYCAYGVVPINLTAQNIRTDGLAVGDQYITPEYIYSHPANLDLLQKISKAAYLWYSGHSLPQHASRILAVIHSEITHVS
jgi:hypothetical protein